MTKSLSKEELIKQLKTLKEKEPEIPMHMGACCYSPAFPNPIEAPVIKTHFLFIITPFSWHIITYL